MQISAPFSIATPEKALMDIFSLKFENSSSPAFADVQAALEEDLRIDMTELKKIINRANADPSEAPSDIPG